MVESFFYMVSVTRDFCEESLAVVETMPFALYIILTPLASLVEEILVSTQDILYFIEEE